MGDIVIMDKEGFIIIEGWVKCFVKIGGEMVLLFVVEGVVGEFWLEMLVCVVI